MSASGAGMDGLGTWLAEGGGFFCPPELVGSHHSVGVPGREREVGGWEGRAGSEGVPLRVKHGR